MYNAIIGIILVLNLLMGFLIWENSRLTKQDKKSFSHVCMIIIVASLSEWLAIILNGANSNTIGIHSIAKCLDYVFTPLFGHFLIKVLTKNKIMLRVSLVLQLLNILLEVVSLFTGWTFYIDAANYYQHGPLFLVYVGIAVSIYIVTFVAFLNYCKNFKKRYLTSLIAIFIFIISGIAVQEILGNNYRVAYLVMSIGCALLYYHYLEYYQQKTDEQYNEQEKLLRIDPLTKMGNRFSYEELLNSLNDEYPNTTVVFSIDINGLKNVNDNFGHQAGDELIIGAAETIELCLSAYGKCFRTGGDEYICILNMPEMEVNPAKQKINNLASKWKGKFQPDLSLSVGYARSIDNPGLSINELIMVADKMMYTEKNAFYKKHPDFRR